MDKYSGPKVPKNYDGKGAYQNFLKNQKNELSRQNSNSSDSSLPEYDTLSVASNESNPPKYRTVINGQEANKENIDITVVDLEDLLANMKKAVKERYPKIGFLGLFKKKNQKTLKEIEELKKEIKKVKNKLTKDKIKKYGKDFILRKTLPNLEKITSIYDKLIEPEKTLNNLLELQNIKKTNPFTQATITKASHATSEFEQKNSEYIKNLDKTLEELPLEYKKFLNKNSHPDTKIELYVKSETNYLQNLNDLKQAQHIILDNIESKLNRLQDLNDDFKKYHLYESKIEEKKHSILDKGKVEEFNKLIKEFLTQYRTEANSDLKIKIGKNEKTIYNDWKASEINRLIGIAKKEVNSKMQNLEKPSNTLNETKIGRNSSIHK
jgi:hypothetical protein